MSEALKLDQHSESELTEPQEKVAGLINGYIEQATAVKKKHDIPKPLFHELDDLDFSDAVGLTQPAGVLDSVKAQWSAILANPRINRRVLYPRFDQPAVFDKYLDDGHIEETIFYRLHEAVALVTVVDFDENTSVAIRSGLWVSRDEINDFVRDNGHNRVTPHPLAKSSIYPLSSSELNSHPVAHP